MTVGEALERAPLFRCLSADERAALAREARLHAYPRGAYLWRSGDADDGVYVVLQGFVQIGCIGPDGEEIVLHVVAPGDTMGEPGVFAVERDRRTDGRAYDLVRAARLPSPVIRALLERSPAALRAFLERLSAIARGHSRRIALTAFHDARGRVARLLLDLAASHGQPTRRGVRIAVPISQRTIAGLTSLRRESVNRILAGYERDGALVCEEGGVTVLEPRALRAALGVDAA